jgi:hypothetical protein
MITQAGHTVKLSQMDIEALPNYRKRTTGGEYSSACPACGGDPAKDTDRFRFWPAEGNYWCRQCNFEGFVIDSASSLFQVTPEMKAEWAKQQAEREAADLASQLTGIERLRRQQPHLTYIRNLNGQSNYIQEKWGLQPDYIEYFKLGYCYSCPTYPESSSISIPYFWQGDVINIRHRLVAPNGCGKYRPEAAGLPSAIFNADILKDEKWIVLVEGEFKAMVLCQSGLPAIAIPGANTFKEKWVNLFSAVDRVFVALDPGALVQGWQIGLLLSKAGVQARVVTLPEKPDDMIIRYRVGVGTFCKYLEMGRLV